ncbi:MAG: LysM peptidoglycan-binding domain-containing protein [Actinobacteria bacterium]|nr:LysM peptidoglycan-binding domain-containing protein [Actinomycetota bacterium]MCA1699910.1 LysM peptidoglycan-binding domain-containing protein [Actinomycetota bacterium]
MRSLNAHLTEAGGHGHLPFHSGCPVCRAARLAGPLPSGPIVSQRAQASLVAALFALSAAGPAAGIAAADTPGGEGTAAPQEDDDPDQQDPGPEIPLPNEIPPPPAPAAGGDDDSAAGPVEGEPQEQLSAPAGTVTTPQPTAPAGPGAAVTPPAAAPAPVAPGAQPPPATDETTQQTDKPSKRKKEAQRHSRKQVRAREPAAGGAATPEAPLAAESPPPALATAAPAAAVTRPVAAPDIPDDADSYLVRSGDSLWSIAKRLRGPRASTAQVAREVNRLWHLNADRIGTGDPNLIMPGQTLRLR